MAFEDIPEDWLFKQITFDQIEQENPPLGFLNKDWNELCRLRQERDELWEFDSPSDHWASLCGRAGIALVRDKHVVCAIVTEMN